jgi:putative nucleotidyltransferase with HDIG domain
MAGAQSKPNILILDPSSVTTQVLIRKLTEVDCEVHGQGIGTHAVDAVRETAPDVILLELSFEEPDTFEILAALREDRSLRKVPIVIHTDRSTRQNVLKSVRAGAKTVIVKPASTETIVARLHAVFEKLGLDDRFQAQVEALEIDVKDEEAGGVPSAAGAGRVVFKENMDAEAKLEVLLRNAKEVEAMPFGVARTLEVSQEKTAGAGELAEVIESDAGITSMVLKRANSVHYAGQQRTVKVKDAIVRIGFGETRNLVLGIAAVKNFDADTKSLGFQRGEFWEHSLAVGLIAKTLAETINDVDRDLCFVAGLIHDLGKLIFDQYMSRQFESALEISGKKGISLGRAEREVFQIDHTDVGRELVERWRFPDEMTEVAHYHNSYSEIDTSLDPIYRPMVKVVYVANALAKAYRMGQSGDEVIHSIPDEFFAEMKLPSGLPDNFLEHVKQALSDYREFLNVPRGEDAAPKHHEFEGKTIYLLQDSRPIVDPYEIYLSCNWGFEVQRLASVEALDDLDDLENAVIILQAKDSRHDREQYETIFTSPFRGHVLLLLEPAGKQDQKPPTPWPNDHVTLIRKPADGRALIAALSQMCEEAGQQKQAA